LKKSRSFRKTRAQDKNGDEQSELTAEPIVQQDPKRQSTVWEMFHDYSLMLWDGLGFFGFDNTKLARLRGQKVTFLTQFKSFWWMATSFITVFAVFYVSIIEFSKLNTLKSKSISLREQDKYIYNATEVLPVVAISYFFVDEILAKVRAFQELNRQNDELKQSKLVPKTWDELDWFDKDYIEWYLCKH